MNKKRNKKQKNKNNLQKLWHFIWHDDSVWSWIVNVILAFLIVKFIFYPGLSLIVGTPLPLVAVTSSSMEHRATNVNSENILMCSGERLDTTRQLSIEDWWNECGEWYEQNTNITLQEFKEFPLRNGFNKGDIILLRGAREIDVGDIIVFEARKPQPIIHRIILKNETTIRTKGDNNPRLIETAQLDETNIPEEKILGKAYAKVPYLGYIKIWFTNLVSYFM